MAKWYWIVGALAVLGIALAVINLAEGDAVGTLVSGFIIGSAWGAFWQLQSVRS